MSPRRAHASDRYGGPAIDNEDRAAAVRRMRAMLDAGRWPTGLPISPNERRIIERNAADLEAEIARRRARGLP